MNSQLIIIIRLFIVHEYISEQKKYIPREEQRNKVSQRDGTQIQVTIIVYAYDTRTVSRLTFVHNLNIIYFVMQKVPLHMVCANVHCTTLRQFCYEEVSIREE